MHTVGFYFCLGLTVSRRVFGCHKYFVKFQMAFEKRMHLLFSGHVQGVGFRYSTRQIAARLNLSGWVRNLSDGRVEAVIEGPATSLEQFVTEIVESTHGHVTDIDRTVSDATGEFSDFEITVTV